MWLGFIGLDASIRKRRPSVCYSFHTETTEGRHMTVKDIAKLGKMLAQFLTAFACCFARSAGRDLLHVYVRGLLSDVQRKNAEAIALDQKIAPRTLQRFLESIVWDEQLLRDRCQQIIATEHASIEAIGSIDETGTAKSGKQTAGVKRQYNGNRGKIENCINNVALAYSAPGFDCLLDARLYLPKEWADDSARRKKITFLTKWNSKPNRKSRWT
jgi:SRSO17 transposase